VLVILDRDARVVFVDRFHRLDWQLQVNRILAQTDRYNRAPTYVDSTGAGEPVYESLRRAGVQAKPYPFTQKSKAALVQKPLDPLRTAPPGLTTRRAARGAHHARGRRHPALEAGARVGPSVDCRPGWPRNRKGPAIVRVGN
jgi:Terminase RNaseH-like domain